MDTQNFITQLEKTHAFTVFLSRFTKTKYPAIFRNDFVQSNFVKDKPWLIIFNSITASGKDVIMNNLISEGIGIKVKTATTRKKRPAEPDDHFVWMREMRENESFEEYHQSLIAEYDLIESNTHHGNVYGLPRKNLYQASNHGVAIMQNEPAGARSLINQVGDDFNMVVLFIVPDSWAQVYERMNRSHETRDNEMIRLQDSVDWMETSQQITHFYIHSTEHPEKYGEKELSGLELVTRSTADLIRDLILNKAKL